MPISPENKKLYPSNWKEIRARILKRADNKCEFCNVPNYADGYRDENGKFLNIRSWPINVDYSQYTFKKSIRIILTIAHIHDMNPANCADDNLKALCQRCHNKHDAKFRAENRKKNAAKQKKDRHDHDQSR